MADDEKFLLVSLNEDKAKKLAQIISNDTCRKIIDFLAEKEASETEIAKQLKIAISTVHYNLKHLMKAGLVIVDEFHYSKKGKEINHYKLANKYIIIAPKQTTRIKEALRKILPIGLITIVGAAVIEFFNMFTMRSSATFGESAAKAVNTLAAEASVADLAIQEASLAGARVIPETARIATTPSIWQHISIWFLMGGLAVIILYLLFEIIRNSKKSRNTTR